MVDISHTHIYIYTQQYTTYHTSYIVYRISHIIYTSMGFQATLQTWGKNPCVVWTAEVSPSKERPFSSCLTIHDVHPTRPSWCRNGNGGQRIQCDHPMNPVWIHLDLSLISCEVATTTGSRFSLGFLRAGFGLPGNWCDFYRRSSTIAIPSYSLSCFRCFWGYGSKMAP